MQLPAKEYNVTVAKVQILHLPHLESSRYRIRTFINSNMKIYYTIYKIENKVNGKIYIGCHKTNDLNDGYMGSGKILKRAHTKYGIENFTKDYIKICDSSDEMFNMEAELVNEEFINRKDTYNLKLGGEGGFDHINATISKQQRIEISRLGGSTRHMSEEERGKRISVGRMASNNRFNSVTKLREKYVDGWTFSDKKHTKETINKMKKSHVGKHDGIKNSQYGTCWIYHPQLKKSKKIKKDELINHLCEGWLTGRRMKIESY